MNIKVLNKNIKDNIKLRIQRQKSEQKDSKYLLLKKNLRNNQNYILWKNKKINNIIYFLWFTRRNDPIFNIIIYKFLWLIFLFFRKSNFSTKFILISILLFFIFLFIIYSVYFSFNLYIFFFIFILLVPFINYFKFKNFDSIKYKVNEDWDYFFRFRRNIYWINNGCVVYKKDNIKDILKYDLMLKNNIKKDRKFYTNNR